MSGKNADGESRLAALLAEPDDPWPLRPGHGPIPFSQYGLYLYLTFEDDIEDEWWPMEDGPLPRRLNGVRLGASRRTSRRSGR